MYSNTGAGEGVQRKAQARSMAARGGQCWQRLGYEGSHLLGELPLLTIDSVQGRPTNPTLPYVTLSFSSLFLFCSCTVLPSSSSTSSLLVLGLSVQELGLHYKTWLEPHDFPEVT